MAGASDGADRPAFSHPLDRVPEAPEWLLEERPPEYWERLAQEHVLMAAGTSAPDRFEAQTGLPWMPEPHVPEAHVPELHVPDELSTEERAGLAQDAVVVVAEVLALAEAHRMVALVTAYECAIDDLVTRFGRTIGARAGLGAQAFFTSMALQLRQHPRRIAHEVDTAMLVRERFPRLWDLFLHGGTAWNRVDTAASIGDGLDEEHWPAYDERAARAVARSSRLKRDLRTAREKLQAGTAAIRARATHEHRTTSLELGHDGEASLVITGPAAVLVACNEAIHRVAVVAHGVPGERRSIAMLRHDLAVDLLHHGLQRATDADAPDVRIPSRRAVAVNLTLTVPALAWLGRTTEQAILDGYGPIALEVAKDLAGDATSFVRVLTDPVTGVRLTMDRKVYAPPADLARWVRIRDSRSRFPGSTRPAHLCDIDHAREWQHAGTTDAGNLMALDRPAHNLKSAGLYQNELTDAGIVGWTDAWGRWFEDPPADPLDPAPPELLPDDPIGEDDGPPPF